MHNLVKDLTGQRFGRLTATTIAPRTTRAVAWECVCDCGGRKTALGLNLIRGRTRSCGCLKAETSRATLLANQEAFTKQPVHGLTNSPTWRSWAAMIQRCTNPARSNWPYYGGRGIRVCDRWHSFALFFKDMGLRPDGMTIDRRENSGDYEPDNCFWATAKQQAANRRPRTRRAG